MSWPCFWVEETDRCEIELRRFTWSDDTGPECADGRRFHSAWTVYGTRKTRRTADHYLACINPAPFRSPGTKASKMWPKKCESCDYEFVVDDEWQINQNPIYVRPDTGESWTIGELPVGALYDSPWQRDWGVGPDGIALVVVLPEGAGGRDHPWHIDGPANDGSGVLKPGAWTRTGDPKAVPPTVDVNPSIQTATYHSYLHAGVLGDPM